jgi:hypothetical protein
MVGAPFSASPADPAVILVPRYSSKPSGGSTSSVSRLTVRQEPATVINDDTNALIRRSQDFVPVVHAFYGDKDSQRENFEIFHAWRHKLFHIPKDDKDLLGKSAQSIDALLHATLDKELSTTVVSSRRRESNKNSRGNLIDFVTTGVYAWGRLARMDSSSAPEKAEVLVSKLQELTRNTKDAKMSSVYAAMVYCWSQAVDHQQALERASHWFDRIENTPGMTTNSETFNAYLRTIVRHEEFDTEKTQKLLERHSSLKDGYTYASVVRRWMDSEDPDGLQKAYEALQCGITYCLEHHTDQIVALQQLLFDYLSQNVLSKQHDVTSNENVLHQMISMQQTHPDKPILQRKHFVVVMRDLATRGEAERMNRLFEAMQELYSLGNSDLEPDYQVLVIVLSALTKTQDYRYMQSIEKLLSLIEEQVLSTKWTKESITNYAFNVVLDFYSRAPGISERRRRIETLMHQMEEWADRCDDPELLPDRISYSSLIRAIVAEKEDGFATEIDNIVDEMESSQRAAMLPDASTYTLVLDGYLESGDQLAVEWAERLKKRMITKFDLQPDEIFYTLLMKIYSLSGDAESSDSILDELIAAFKSGREHCRPTEEAFVTAMSSWERSGRRNAADAALRLFNRMVRLYKDGFTDCRPGPKTFGQLMVILAKSAHENKRQIARRLLGKMKELNITPDLMVLNWYIRVCATATKDEQDRQESWRDAQATLHILRKSQKGANSHTYNSMLHACHNLFNDVDDQRLKNLREIFEKCKDDGLVDRRIITTLKRLLHPKEFEDWTTLNGNEQRISMHKLPQEWQRHKTSRQ